MLSLAACRRSLLGAFALILAGSAWAGEPAKPTKEQAKFFEQKIRPLLATNCFKCHGPDKQRGNLRLDSLSGMLTGGESGPAIVPDKPDQSHLVEAINYGSWEMPPDGKLPEDQIALLTNWIKQGAPWPDAGKTVMAAPKEKITDKDRAFWSYQPIRRPSVPELNDNGWSANDIDRFILEKLKSEKLQPAEPADPVSLIRRLTFDLTGIPPTAAEVAEFQQSAIRSPQSAIDSAVERLLNSPRYGEHVARYWLDLVRYAESDGHRQDAFRPHAWHYRDYVIRAFNGDKPYDRFVLEQLAGDEIAPDDPDALAATAYLRQGIYEYNQRNVRQQWSDTLNDITDVTADVFLGLGMGCCRCHDHKFDPLLQKDYFRLQAFFTPLLPRDDVPLATPTQKQAYAEQLAGWEAATEDVRRKIDAIEQPYRDRAAKGAIEKFPLEIQGMMRKDNGERAPLEEQLHQLAYRQVTYEYERLAIKGDDKTKLDELRQELVQFDKLKPEPLPLGMSVTDVGPVPGPTFIPGDRKQKPIEPGFPTVICGSEPAAIEPISTSANTTGRRTALARWITSEANPLAARVMVNRLWQQHFGAGLVATPSDYGTLGERPSHPELLDWLAAEFIDSGWSIKHLHRLMVTSATYRQTALRPAPAVALKNDPDNRWLWRMNTRRLQAEQIRDAALAASGELDLTAGGVSVPTSKPRRSIYTTAIRNTRDPLLDVFDLPDSFSSVPERNVTTTPTQSLLLINGDWMLGRAKALASKLKKNNSADEALINAAWQAVYSRPPTPQQRASALRFLQAQAGRIGQPADQLPAPIVQAMPERGGWAAVIEPGTSQERLRVSDNASLPGSDFTVEAFVMLRSLFADATVRTIASQWDGNNQHAGWSLGVTSEKSKYKPRNLILQLIGDSAKGGAPYEVLASGLHLELNKPYYVACSVRIADTSQSGVTFYLHDLTDDKPTASVGVVHQVTGHYRSSLDLIIGGRDKNTSSGWDGLIDDVRLTTAALSPSELLINGLKPHDKTAGFWRFENEPGFYVDSSAAANGLRPQASGKSASNARDTALIDFCHVLLNSNEFLYVD